MKKTTPKKRDSFSKFFLDATEEEKMMVFTKVAKKANKDQRALIKRAKLKLRGA